MFTMKVVWNCLDTRYLLLSNNFKFGTFQTKNSLFPKKQTQIFSVKVDKLECLQWKLKGIVLTHAISYCRTISSLDPFRPKTVYFRRNKLRYLVWKWTSLNVYNESWRELSWHTLSPIVEQFQVWILSDQRQFISEETNSDI